MRRWSEEADEIVRLAEAGAVGIVHPWRGVLRQGGAVPLRAVLVGKDRGGDPHLVEEGVGVELEQRRLCRLPAESAYAQRGNSDFGDHRGTSGGRRVVSVLPRGDGDEGGIRRGIHEPQS